MEYYCFTNTVITESKLYFDVAYNHNKVSTNSHKCGGDRCTFCGQGFNLHPETTLQNLTLPRKVP